MNNVVIHTNLRQCFVLFVVFSILLFSVHFTFAQEVATDTEITIEEEVVEETIPLETPVDILDSENTVVEDYLPGGDGVEEMIDTEPVEDEFFEYESEEDFFDIEPQPENDYHIPGKPHKKAYILFGDENKKDPTKRNYSKKVTIDFEAPQTCEASQFSVSIKNKLTVRVDITVNKEYGDILEIGSLPKGIDMVFSTNNNYIYEIQGNETSIPLLITKKVNAQQGSFSIPILYTNKKIGRNSVSICQITILNLI